MKNLIFLFLGFSCFANSQTDSLRIVQKLNQLDKANAEAKMIIKKLDKIDNENETLIYKIKTYIKKLTIRGKIAQKSIQTQLENSQAIKADNINEPVTEITTPDGYDSIRRGFIYRLFHKDKIFIKPFKIVNYEKVYLD